MRVTPYAHTFPIHVHFFASCSCVLKASFLSSRTSRRAPVAGFSAVPGFSSPSDDAQYLKSHCLCYARRRPAHLAAAVFLCPPSIVMPTTLLHAPSLCLPTLPLHQQPSCCYIPSAPTTLLNLCLPLPPGFQQSAPSTPLFLLLHPPLPYPGPALLLLSCATSWSTISRQRF